MQRASRKMFQLISKAINFSNPNFMRSVVLPVVVAAVALATAFIGALIIGSDSGIDDVNLFVERLSGDSSSWLGGLVGASALFALAAGMASAVNPCGFAMLPAYLGMYLGDAGDPEKAVRPIQQIGRAVLVGLTVTTGFVVLFGIVGLIIGLGASFIGDLLQWLGLFIGIGLALVGARMVGGGKLYTGVAARAASHMGNPAQVSMKGYFIFGISYGTASLSCTLPIFLAVVGISVAGRGASLVLSDFLLFALGMGMVIMALTLGMAFFKTAMVGALRKILPYTQPVGAWLMVIAGTYIVFYWLTIGGLL
ncbi:MAG: cytochrome c biogenesis protein CcdA [SAR202 cluster bacterium]|nr:cytochrome c biogenesis protein CcdA [SAR202 cluster bacterium]